MIDLTTKRFDSSITVPCSKLDVTVVRNRVGKVISGVHLEGLGDRDERTIGKHHLEEKSYDRPSLHYQKPLSWCEVIIFLPNT